MVDDIESNPQGAENGDLLMNSKAPLTFDLAK